MVDVSLQEAIIPTIPELLPQWQFDRYRLPRSGSYGFPGAAWQRVTWPCKDGQIGMRIMGVKAVRSTSTAIYPRWRCWKKADLYFSSPPFAQIESSSNFYQPTVSWAWFSKHPKCCNRSISKTYVRIVALLITQNILLISPVDSYIVVLQYSYKEKIISIY